MTDLGELLTIKEAAKAYKICRTNLYAAMNAGKLSAIKIGRSTRIRRADMDALLATMPVYQSKSSETESR
jgi:excisionase family DNA binding protein